MTKKIIKKLPTKTIYLKDIEKGVMFFLHDPEFTDIYMKVYVDEDRINILSDTNIPSNLNKNDSNPYVTVVNVIKGFLYDFHENVIINPIESVELFFK